MKKNRYPKQFMLLQMQNVIHACKNKLEKRIVLLSVLREAKRKKFAGIWHGTSRIKILKEKGRKVSGPSRSASQ